MSNHPPDLETLLKRHLLERFNNKGAWVLARAVNERFCKRGEAEFLSRNTIDNWLKGISQSAREWEQLAAISAVLNLSEVEADELLLLAQQKTIAEKRLTENSERESRILDHWSQPAEMKPAETTASTTSAAINRPPPVSYSISTQSNVSWGWVVIPLLLLPIGWFGWRWFTLSAPAPQSTIAANAMASFVDDFSNADQWNFNEASYVQVEDGRLWVDTPLNRTGQWHSDVALPRWNVATSIARIRFTVALEMAEDQTWGFLGVQTECYSEQHADDDGDNDWLLVYIGGSDRTLWIEYTPVDAEANLQILTPTPIVANQPYTIDMQWGKSGLQVYLNDKAQGPEIPCLRPRQFHLNAGLDVETQVRGYIDDLRVWN